ncbi:uncharacterized protein LOC144148305 [Haemaphysalis longicornis]
MKERSIDNLQAYYNTCWRAGKLPKQWKSAKTTPIPKPGKPPNIENLLQISYEPTTEPTTEDNRAILSLDLKIAFIKKRTYYYIRNFLTKRTTEINDGDRKLPEKKLGSVGTPQGSIISLLLFNLLVIGVAERLSRVAGVRCMIYADDITLCVQKGGDGYIASTLQEALDALDEQVDVSALESSPSKS